MTARYKSTVLAIAIAIASQASLPLVAQPRVSLAASEVSLPDAPSQTKAGTQSAAIPPQQGNGATYRGPLWISKGQCCKVHA